MSEGLARYRDRLGREVEVGYNSAGRGPAVALIHGVGLQKSIWAPQIAALAGDHEVIAVDMLGHGASSRPPEAPRLADYAAAVRAVLDALDIEKADLVGHSMGALVALEFALNYPERTRSVVAMNAVFCRTSEQRAAIAARVGELDGARLPDWSGTLMRWFGKPAPPELRPAAAHAGALLAAADPVGYARSYRLFAEGDADHGARLAELAVPALFLTGAEDPNSTPAMSAAMARLAPQGRLVVMPGMRHMMALTHADAVNRELRGFLASLESRPAPFDPRAFRKALGGFLTGVTVVATVQPDGTPRGFTANSFTSVSLDPPLVLVCIAKTAASCPIFSAAEGFSVNILAEHQADVSGLFASKSPDKFGAVAWRRGPAGNPVLDEVAAWFDCARQDVVDAGDHVILIGRVQGFAERAVNPLGYCKGAHITFGLQLDALAASGGRTRVGSILERDGALVLVDDGRGNLDIPKGAAVGAATDSDSLAGNLKRLGIEAELGFLFAVYEDPARGATAMSIIYRGQLRSLAAAREDVMLAPFDEIPWGRIKDAALAAMLRRYIDEKRQDLFGVYVGDAERGTVQPLARTA
ncbi:MAG: alpha/beta fold hydrolase [Pseudomonadota bacterium]|nr:alpha/beta fold hydrolase [Pseudomonadota bacterium]